MSSLLLLALSASHATTPETAGMLGGGGLDRTELPAPIINGDHADEDTYPMAGGILVDAHVGSFPFKMLVCSSTLIAPDTVMLAAHCVDPETLTQMAMGLNIEVDAFFWTRQADLTDYDGSDPGIDVPDGASRAPFDDDHVVFHEDFDLNEMGLGVADNHDIALLFLETPATGQWGYLPTADEATQIAEDVEVDVVGWGQQTGDQQPPPGTYGEKEVGTSFIAELGDDEFKVGHAEDDVRKCHGDSGGPTFWHATTDALESLRVIGVTSHAYDFTDCRETGGVDTRVDAHLEWITEAMTSRCESGVRSWCDEPGIPSLPYDLDEDGILDWQDEKIRKGMCSATSGEATFLMAWVGLATIVLRRRGRISA